MAVDIRGWLRRAPGPLERIEACFAGPAYSPHRHDTYAVGITLDGVQTFDYRGEVWRSLPGQMLVLHPDELHDGRAGDASPFRYRTAYIVPAELQAIIAGPLPFVRVPVTDDHRLRGPVEALLGDHHRPVDELEQTDALYDLAVALQAIAGTAAVPRGMTPNAWAAAARARSFYPA